MFIYEATRVLIVAALAFFVALLLTPFWEKILHRLQFKKQIRDGADTPVFRKFHEKKAGTPTAGGVIIWGTVALIALFFWVLDLFDASWGVLNFVDRGETYLPLAALIIAALVGLFDDWYGILGKGGASGGGLKVRHKLILYTLLAALGAWWFYFRLEFDTLTIPFIAKDFPIGAWYIPLFIFVIVATSFSANETDGLDGLLGGVALFAFVALTAVAFVLHRYDLAVFGGAMIGALLAFLWFNIYPARFFMGDTGSMSLGVTIGTITMLTSTEFFLPFFGIILVLESLSVIIQLVSKKMRGKKVFHSTPLHHHFEALGWPESQITMRFWIISAMFTSLGLALFFLSRFF